MKIAAKTAELPGASWSRFLAALIVAGACGLGTARAESLLLTGANVHTVSGESLAPGQVLIRDGRIAEVGQNITAAGAKKVDLDGLHLYPGLIAVHTTLGLLEIPSVRATRDTTEVGHYTPDVKSWIAVNPDSELIPVARANGVTHAHCVPFGGTVSGLSGLMALTGWTIEDMTRKAPVALHLNWPDMELDTRPKEAFADKSKWKSLEEQAKLRRSRLKETEGFFAEASAYAKAREAAATDNAGQEGKVPAWEAMLPFMRGEIPLMVRAEEIRQIKAAVDWAGANEHRIVIVGGRDAWQAADLLASKQIPVVFENIYTQPAQDTASYDIHFKAPALLYEAGVKVVLTEGDRFDASQLRNLPYSAAQAAAFGLPKEEALKAITLNAAEVLGVDDRLGSIEAGKEATLFVADGDILDVRSNVKRMWIDGKEVSLESRHTRLYERYRARPRAN